MTSAEKNQQVITKEHGDAAARKRSRVRRGVIATLIGGALWGLNGTVSKWLMDAYAIDPLWLVCLRELTTCWIFFAAACATQRGREGFSQLLQSRSGWMQAALVGVVGVLFSQVSYLSAINWINSATATIMQSLGMALVLAYVCLHNRRSPRKREAVGVTMALIGTFLVATGGNPAEMNLPPMGLFWGAACAIAAACLSIVPVRPMARWGNFSVNGMGFLLSGLLITVLYRPWEHMPTLDMLGIGVLVFSVVFGTFGAYALYMQGVADAGPMRAAMLGTIEPLTATAATVFWLGTSFSPAELIGFALILGMVYLTA